jgi:hypothetical protein
MRPCPGKAFSGDITADRNRFHNKNTPLADGVFFVVVLVCKIFLPLSWDNLHRNFLGLRTGLADFNWHSCDAPC